MNPLCYHSALETGLGVVFANIRWDFIFFKPQPALESHGPVCGCQGSRCCPDGLLAYCRQARTCHVSAHSQPSVSVFSYLPILFIPFSSFPFSVSFLFCLVIYLPTSSLHIKFGEERYIFLTFSIPHSLI